MVGGNRRADDCDVGDGLQRPLGWLHPGCLGGDPRPVAFEAGWRADQHVTRGRAAVIGQSVGDVAWGEREIAGTLDLQHTVDLEYQLALKQVEGLVEVVRVQRRAALCAGTTISVMDTWPLVSSLRSRTAARGGRFGISFASFNSMGRTPA